MPTVKKVRKTKKSTNAPKQAKTGFTLPTEDNVPPDSLSDSAFLLFGRKAIGKTSLANKFPDTVTLMFERGRRNLKIRQAAVTRWEEFLEAVDQVKESAYQSVVIDTLDKCYIQCFNYICGNAGIKHPDQSSKPYEVWDAITQEFTETIYSLQESDKGLILLSHESPKPLVVSSKPLRRDDEEGEERKSRMEPSCKPAGIRVVQEICDYVFYYCFVSNQRVISVRSPNEYAWTACGLDDHFLDPDGNPIQRFAVGNSADSAYQSLLDAYNNKLYDLDHKPPTISKKRGRNGK